MNHILKKVTSTQNTSLFKYFTFFYHLCSETMVCLWYVYGTCDGYVLFSFLSSDIKSVAWKFIFMIDNC